QSNLFAPRRTYSQLPYPAELPQQITGLGQHQTQPYLAEQASLQLSDIADKISRNTGSRLLLHTSWRQAPVTERRAIASRWFAGKNFSQQYDYWGQPVTDTLSVNDNALAGVTAETDSTLPTDTAPSSDQLLSNIEQLLQQLNANSQLPDTPVSALDSINSNEPLTVRNLPDQVWQLDGLFKLHLDHYLFVNTEFNLRLPADNALQTLYIRQSRRVISGEIHYLDHPYLGIVLQIRRYEPPQEEASAENTSTSTAPE
ncbi:MAG TPA: CsiV family protein, partial [Rheinheimera sp.]|nr:CsiV family protein [Rheinheimera sp.]